MSSSTIDKDQERLFKDLLPILDALDQACLHWEEARSLYHASRSPVPLPVPKTTNSPSPKPPQPSFWKSVWLFLNMPLRFPNRSPQEVSQDVFQEVSQQVTPEPPEAQLPADERSEESEESSWEEILESGQEGAELIRQMVLDLMKHHGITPLEAVGKPFNGKYMVALGQDRESEYPANTVTQEVVRGYIWSDRVLREAQVMVAVPKS